MNKIYLVALQSLKTRSSASSLNLTVLRGPSFNGKHGSSIVLMQFSQAGCDGARETTRPAGGFPMIFPSCEAAVSGRCRKPVLGV